MIVVRRKNLYGDMLGFCLGTFWIQQKTH